MSLLLLVACTSGKPNPADACEVDDDLGDGEGRGSLGGENWAPQGITWIWAGTSLQVVVPPFAGHNVTVVAQSDRDGVAVKDAADAEDFPILVELVSGGGGFATVYPDKGDSYSTNLGEGGTLQILRADASDGFVGCMDFVAATDSGDTRALEDGQFRAVPG